ncbi:hypothetical protein MNBD_GAMMA16-249 [hydrothermal vent metagenome]|uniref:non-specific protein-tyrosine kinase n=1 Tax=hydrothermal vent metagenome TaxID=652676 RepID=A0A3B0ZNT8_9ZZZZ
MTNNKKRKKNFVEVDIFKILKSSGFTMDDLEQNQIKEAFRHIKRPLLKKVVESNVSDSIANGNVIMIVSAHPEEGKTFVASNLAASIAAEKDKAVLLIDADVARSSVSQFFGIKAQYGFVEYLLGEKPNLANLIIKTTKSNFEILPAGRRYKHSTELFSSEKTKQLMHELASQNKEKIIILDSPPLFAASESMALAELAGQIIVVVASGSNHKELKGALEFLDLSRVTGTVFNKSRSPSRPYYYGYADQ